MAGPLPDAQVDGAWRNREAADLLGALGEVAQGELMRFFAEAAWYPTALLPSQGVRWQAVDDTSAAILLKNSVGALEAPCARVIEPLVGSRLAILSRCVRSTFVHTEVRRERIEFFNRILRLTSRSQTNSVAEVHPTAP